METDDLSWVLNLEMCGEECPVLLHHCGMSCFVVERKALQRVVKAPQSIVGSIPQTTVTTNIYTSSKRASLSWKTLLTQETDCLSHSPLPSGWMLRSINCRTTRLRNSFFFRLQDGWTLVVLCSLCCSQPEETDMWSHLSFHCTQFDYF